MNNTPKHVARTYNIHALTNEDILIKSTNPKILFITISLLIGFVLLPLIWNVISTTKTGGNDFFAYWSATYLFLNGENPYDADLLDTIQHIQLQSGLEYTIRVWNVPTLFVFLLPLGLLSFSTAKFVLLLTNLFIMATFTLMLSRLYLSKGSSGLIVVYFIFAFSMPQVITGFYMGQVNFLVFLGLASSMVLIKKEKWFWAGAVLILTSIKPHLVILAVIYLLIIMAQRRQFVGWAGLLCGSIACAIILFIFRPPWIYDFFGMLAIPPVNWATPTLGGLLNSQQISNYFILLLLPLPFLLANLQRSISMEFSIALLTVITVPFTFFGWSYDQTILLIPIAQLFIWIYHLNNKSLNFGFASICTISLLINYWQRILNINEVYYVWVPLVWCLVFGLTWRLYSEKQGVL